MFRRSLPAALLAAALLAPLLLSTPRSVAADERDFQLVNNSGQTIVSLYVSPAHHQGWEEDVLGLDVVPPGQMTNIRFSPRDADAWECFYDIRIVDGRGVRWDLFDVNLCATDRVVFD